MDKVYYQPYPFPDLRVNFRCNDCEERYLAIKRDFGSFKDRLMLDFYAASSYFGFRFLQDGGKEVLAIESNNKLREEVNQVAEQRGFPLYSFSDADGLPAFSFDIALLLDSYGYADTDEYMEIIKQRCGVSYISTPSPRMNEKVARALEKDFMITPIYEGKEGRLIFRCHK